MLRVTFPHPYYYYSLLYSIENAIILIYSSVVYTGIFFLHYRLEHAIRILF